MTLKDQPARPSSHGKIINPIIPMRKSVISKCALFAAALLAAVGSFTAQASSSLITFSVDMSQQAAESNFNPDTDQVAVQGTFNNWNPFIFLVRDGTNLVYTNTYNDTLEANGSVVKYQFVRRDAGSVDHYETSFDFNLRAARLPANSGDSLILPTPFFNDDDGGANITNDVTFQVDVSQQIALGNFTPGTTSVEVRGKFNGWGGGNTLTNDPSILRTNQFGLVTSNVYVGTVSVVGPTNAAMDYKYVLQPGTAYEGVSSANGDNGGNRFFTQRVPLVLPVVDYNDAPFAPISQVTFNLDMSVVAPADPGYDPTTVRIAGDFNSWTADVPLTNDPASANPNLFKTTINIGEGAAVNYQFRYNSFGSTVYDHPASNPGGNRFYQVPAKLSNNVSTVFFNDVAATDSVNVDTSVIFRVDMTGATTTTGHQFDPNADSLFLNGDFVGWLGWDPISLSGQQMTNDPPGSSVYSFTTTFSKGHSRSVAYKMSINGPDNEAPSGQNHFRYIRSTNGVYTMPVDKFGNQLVEPKFGNLAIGKPAGGSIPITWLGYPGVHLQTATSLRGTWNDQAATDAQNSTNWPFSGGNQFFRLSGH